MDSPMNETTAELNTEPDTATPLTLNTITEAHIPGESDTFDHDADLRNELDKINKLELSQIEAYLKTDPKKLLPNVATANE